MLIVQFLLSKERLFLNLLVAPHDLNWPTGWERSQCTTFEPRSQNALRTSTRCWNLAQLLPEQAQASLLEFERLHREKSSHCSHPKSSSASRAISWQQTHKWTQLRSAEHGSSQQNYSDTWDRPVISQHICGLFVTQQSLTDTPGLQHPVVNPSTCWRPTI